MIATGKHLQKRKSLGMKWSEIQTQKPARNTMSEQAPGKKEENQTKIATKSKIYPPKATKHQSDLVNHVTKARNDALWMLHLPTQATSRDVALKHCTSSRKLYPDEWNRDRNFTAEEACEMIKRASSAKELALSALSEN